MFETIFKNNGLIDNSMSSQTSKYLKQGEDFINNEQKTKKYTFSRLPFLELTSMPNVMSINEAFNGDDSTVAKNKDIADNLSTNEVDFNKTLTEYSTLQKNLESSAFHHNVDKQVNETIMKQLSELNKKLITQAKNINTDMSNLHVNSESLKKHINNQQSSLNTYIHTLRDEQIEINEDLNGKIVSSKLTRVSNKYHYFVWLIFLITLLSLTYHILTSNFAMNTMLVIISLVGIYMLARFINNRYM